MYVLLLNAVPDGSIPDYDTSQSYPIIVIVNTLSEDYAIEKAEKVLLESHWKEINFQKIGLVPPDEQGKYTMEDPIDDHRIFVFQNNAKKGGVHGLMNKAKILVSKLTLRKP